MARVCFQPADFIQSVIYAVRTYTKRKNSKLYAPF